ncbi:hypothetical protein KY284_033265 [Solanum tuberosum]|nr:hypothetical protein KY284_033265 [Solanum tuberosum]
MSCQSNGGVRKFHRLVTGVFWCIHKLQVKCVVLTLMVSSSDTNGPMNMYKRVTKDSGGN